MCYVDSVNISGRYANQTFLSCRVDIVSGWVSFFTSFVSLFVIGVVSCTIVSVCCIVLKCIVGDGHEWRLLCEPVVCDGCSYIHHCTCLFTCFAVLRHRVIRHIPCVDFGRLAGKKNDSVPQMLTFARFSKATKTNSIEVF